MEIQHIEKGAVVEANRAINSLEVKDAITRVRDCIAEFDRLHNGEGLTEKGKDGPQAMSDATRMKLILEQAKVLNELGKTAFEFSKDMHIPVETLKIWAVQILQLLQRVCITKKEYEYAAKEFTKIMAGTGNPNMMMADVEAKSEVMPKKSSMDIDVSPESK
jgi:hypothetical protein